MKRNKITSDTKKQLIIAGIITGVAVVSVFLYLISSHFPELVTRYYSHSVFNIINLPMKFISSFLPFSLGEILLILIIIAFILYFILTVIKSIKAVKSKKIHPWKYFLSFIVTIIIIAETAVTIFIWSGGFNYKGLTIERQLNFPDRNYTSQELYDMTLYYIEKANQLRTTQNESENNVTVSPYNFSEMTELAEKAYVKIPSEYKNLLADGYYPSAKPAISSEWMCYTNITGIYPYLIPEAIVNTKTPDITKPSTLCHEMAHQRAIAREDEANFISFIVCTYSSDTYFQYSGYYLATVNCLNSLYSVNYQLWTEAWKHLSEDVKKDITASHQFWQKYETQIAEISEKVNDTYLQANNIKDGVDSYGRLTDLLLSDYYN